MQDPTGLLGGEGRGGRGHGERGHRPAAAGEDGAEGGEADGGGGRLVAAGGAGDRRAEHRSGAEEGESEVDHPWVGVAEPRERGR